ncbi:hypothetical protein HMPREF0494_0911 [Limosilactobacillus antri DSM 16041]|uniref:Type I restriction modification DNA specificity domain-containing protein n=2 Tax=Limosilactobacillus antri DSM 16041 TaxID=525309 RepID=C8P6G7_9LACO|nr:hypothetical protein HMPREF0494_0911 [Limosilactobacillus antri DSM 16041]
MQMQVNKDSGIKWVGEIPDNWDSVPIYYVSQEVRKKNNNISQKVALKFTYGTIVRKKNFSIEEDSSLRKTIENYKVVKPKDIVINGLNLNFDFVTQRVGFVTFPGAITSAYIVIRAKNNINEKYLLYLLKSYDSVKAFHNMGGGVRKILNFSILSKIKIPFPPMKEQKRITDFLDKKCGKIDKLLSQINDEIDTLKKYQHSLIIRVVTKGLDSNVPTKDSGIEWIGTMPEKWNVVKGKFILTLLDRPTKKDDEVITCFRDGQVTLRKKRRTDGFTISTKEIGYQGVDVGDLVVHAMDGFAGAIGISDSRGKASPVLNVMDSSENKNYLKYYLRCCAYLGVFNALAKGIRVRTADTRWSTLANLKFPLPTKNEQKDISDYLDQKCAEIRALINEKNRQLDLLTKYKNSLIFEYVTGKKQVPQI